MNNTSLTSVLVCVIDLNLVIISTHTHIDNGNIVSTLLITATKSISNVLGSHLMFRQINTTTLLFVYCFTLTSA